MDEKVRKNLTDIKKAFESFGWWLAKVGVTIERRDVTNAIEVLEIWRAEVETALLQDEDGAKLNELLIAWIDKAREGNNEPDTYQAVVNLSEINEPNLITITTKINTYIFKRTGDRKTYQ